MSPDAIIPIALSGLLALLGVIYSARKGAKSDLYGHLHTELVRLKEERDEEKQERGQMSERLDAIEYNQDVTLAHVEKLERHIQDGLPPPPPERPILRRILPKGMQQ